MGRVLVTGATGFLAGALIRSLGRDGVDVVATGRDRDRLDRLSLPEQARIAFDLSQFQISDVLSRLSGVTTIVHCAALSSAWGRDAAFVAANVTATENLLTLAGRLGVRSFIHISSPSVCFRFADQIGVTEDQTLPPPVNAYARTKAQAEARVRASPFPQTILRPRAIYGRGDTALLPRLLRAAATGPLPRFRQGCAATDLTHVSDVVAAIRAVMDQPDAAAGQTFNISGGQATPIRDVVERVCAAWGQPVRWRSLPVGPALAAVRLAEAVARMRPGQPEPRVTAYGLGIFAYSQTLDLSRARDLLGWSPKVSFEHGLDMTLFAKEAP